MRDPYAQLRYMQDAIQKIEAYVSKGRHQFDQQEETRLSLIHYLLSIQETAQNISQAFKKQHPDNSQTSRAHP